MTAHQPLAVESGAALPNRRPIRAFTVGDIVAPVGNHRPPALMTGTGGPVVDVLPDQAYPVAVRGVDAKVYYFRPDELALAGDWETVR